MNVSIFGLGYVGAVTAGCMASKGVRVIGVDTQQAKVEALNAGEAPVTEPGLAELLSASKAKGLLSAIADPEKAILDSDVSVVCVGTPSLESGELNLDYVERVTRGIAGALRGKSGRHVLAYRSTMLPGSTRSLAEGELRDLIEKRRLEVIFCPEFLREGTAVEDFLDPSLKVLGTEEGLNPRAEAVVDLFGADPAVVRWEEAELIKYACNYFHALKVSFANEIGRTAKRAGIDGARVMEIFCRDHRLNISPYYLRPGNPFGGSCLPKDVAALRAYVEGESIDLPVLEGVLSSNRAHLESLLRLVEGEGAKRVAILGLAFKRDTDDLRGSPMVHLARTLLERDYEVRVFDPHLNLAGLIGSNQAVMEKTLPELPSLLTDSVRGAVAGSDVIVAAQRSVPITVLRSCVTSKHRIIDVNGWPELKELPGRYEGLCW